MAPVTFDWDEANVEHIACHRFAPEEVEEVFQGRCKIRRTRHGYYVALGATLGGRLAFIVSQQLPRRTIRVITARDMNDWERRMFRRK